VSVSCKLSSAWNTILKTISLPVDITYKYLEVKLAGEQKLQVTYVVDILSPYLLLWFC